MPESIVERVSAGARIQFVQTASNDRYGTGFASLNVQATPPILHPETIQLTDLQHPALRFESSTLQMLHVAAGYDMWLLSWRSSAPCMKTCHDFSNPYSMALAAYGSPSRPWSGWHLLRSGHPRANLRNHHATHTEVNSVLAAVTKHLTKLEYNLPR